MNWLISVWRFLSWPLLVAAGVCGYYGFQAVLDAQTVPRPRSVSQILVETPARAFFRDSLAIRAQDAGLIEPNIMGIRATPLAVFPARALNGRPGDSLSPFVIVTDRPELLGPVVERLYRDIDDPSSLKVDKSGTGDQLGAERQRAKVLLAGMVDRLKDHLADSIPPGGRFEGILHRKTAADFPAISGLAPIVYEIRLDTRPNYGRGMLLLLGGLVALALGLLSYPAARRQERLEAEREEAERDDRPLV